MKIFEIVNRELEKELDFDLVDDLIHFIQADPTFYRTKYFPVVDKFKHSCKKDKILGSKIFVNIVNDAYEIYKSKFKLEDLPEQLPKHMLKDICHKLKSMEYDDFQRENSDD